MFDLIIKHLHFLFVHGIPGAGVSRHHLPQEGVWAANVNGAFWNDPLPVACGKDCKDCLAIFVDAQGTNGIREGNHPVRVDQLLHDRGHHLDVKLAAMKLPWI